MGLQAYKLQLEYSKVGSYARSISPAGATRAPTPSRLRFLELCLSRYTIKDATGSLKRLEILQLSGH
jgi:hypothetical protein